MLALDHFQKELIILIVFKQDGVVQATCVHFKVQLDLIKYHVRKDSTLILAHPVELHAIRQKMEKQLKEDLAYK
jgi:hypothetical protein